MYIELISFILVSHRAASLLEVVQEDSAEAAVSAICISKSPQKRPYQYTHVAIANFLL